MSRLRSTRPVSGWLQLIIIISIIIMYLITLHKSLGGRNESWERRQSRDQFTKASSLKCLPLTVLTITTGRRRLIRSSNVGSFMVPRTCTSLGEPSFTVAGPRLSNNFPFMWFLTGGGGYSLEVPPIAENASALLKPAVPSDCWL